MDYRGRIAAQMKRQAADKTSFATNKKNAQKKSRRIYHMDDDGTSMIAKYTDYMDADLLSGMTGILRRFTM